MDAAVVAQLTSAIVVGSQSTGNVTRAAGLPEDKFIGIVDGTVCRFGDFTVTAFSTPHSTPVLYPGEIAAPFPNPASIRDYREGENFTFHIAHPWGNVLIVPSLGVRERWHIPLRADVVLLGIGGLSTDRQRQRYWDQFVTGSGAGRIYPIHWDNFFKPVRAGPVGKPTWGLSRKLRALNDLALPEQTIGLLPFADEVSLYPASTTPIGTAPPLSDGCHPPSATQHGDRL